MLHVCRFLGCDVGGVWLPLSEVQGAPQARLFLQALRFQPLSETQENSASFEIFLSQKDWDLLFSG